jgi:hypothetical protein
VPLGCRHLADGLASLGNPIGSPVDKLLVGLFRLKTLLGSVDDLLRAPETTIEQRLQVGAGWVEGAAGERWEYCSGRRAASLLIWRHW